MEEQKQLAAPASTSGGEASWGQRRDSIRVGKRFRIEFNNLRNKCQVQSSAVPVHNYGTAGLEFMGTRVDSARKVGLHS